MILLLAAAAHAACTFTQTTYADAVGVVLVAGPGHVPCRTVGFTADVPLTVEAWLLTGEGRRRRLDDEAVRPLLGGGWELRVPTLREGDRIEAKLGLPADGLQVRLGPPPEPRWDGARRAETWTLSLDPEHPEWAFADPSRGHTAHAATWTFAAESGPLLVPDPEPPFAGAPAAPVPGGVRWPGGAGEVTTGWTEAGAAAQGARWIPPGSLTLLGPGVEWVTGGEVLAEPVEGGVRFTTDTGGVARWRVARAGGAPVIPDVATFVAGLEWRFARRSLPEPAVPVRLKALRDPGELVTGLLDEVRSLVSWQAPEADPLQPRSLNRAWRSGWATPVEQALILHRFLGQEKMRAQWVLTGADADPVTLTGYTHGLVRAWVGDRELWLDPGCAVCAPGEIDPRWMGRPAVGGAAEVPRAPGTLVRRIRLSETTFQVRFEATGAAAVWLREVVADLDLPRRSAPLLTALGFLDGELVGHSAGLVPGGGALAPGVDLLESAEGTLVIEARTQRVPGAPLGGAPPWDGGWRDEL